MLIETIQDAKGHTGSPTLLAPARKRDVDIDRATMYQTIDLLEKLGLSDELDLMHLSGGKHFIRL
jgi:Fe2+ or Zn2+ uptake regulation protein